MNATATSKPAKKNVTFLDYLTADDILHIVRRRLHWLLICAFAVSVVTAAYVRAMPDLYRADTLILVDPQKVPEQYVTPTVSTDVGGRLNTISQEIMSSTRLQKLIDTYDLYRPMRGSATSEEIIDQMRKDIEVKVIRNTDATRRSLGAFRISYQGANPGVVAQVCNQLASLFIDQNLKSREQQAEGTSEFLDAQLADAKKNLELTEAKVRDFKLTHMGELPEQANANVATLNRLQTELQAQTDALERARQQQVYLQAVLASAPAAQPGKNDAGGEGQAASLSPAADNLARLQKRKAQIQADVESLKGRYKADYPDVRHAEAQLRDVEYQVAAAEAALARAPARPAPAVAAVSAPANDPHATIREQLKAIQSDISNRSAEQARITAQIRTYQGHLDNMPAREQEIVSVMRDYEMSKNFYQSLLEKKMSADMASDLEKLQKSERFTVLDPPRTPEKPIKPNRPLLYGMGAIAGVFVGFALIALIELKDRSIRKEEEVVIAGLPIIARIPVVETEMEVSLARRRSMLRWAIGGVASVAITGILALVATLAAKGVY